MKRLLILLFLSIGFINSINANVVPYCVSDGVKEIKDKEDIFKFNKTCNCNEPVNSWNECVGKIDLYHPQDLTKLLYNYFGEFNFGTQSGYGIAKFSTHNKMSYVGMWENGRWNGEGFQSWPNGSSRGGNYKNSKLNGQGYGYGPKDKKCKKNPSKLCSTGGYKGGYKDDKFHGQGVLFTSRGLIQGIWKEGEFEYPDNGFKSGDSWKCKSGFTKIEMFCLKIPLNTFVSGDRFKCNPGFARKDKDIRNGCARLPNNAYAFGIGWLCNSGYKKNGNYCNKKPKNTLIPDILDSIFGSNTNSSSSNSNSSSYKSNSSSYKSNSSSSNSNSSSYKSYTPKLNSNSSSGYKSSFGSTYKYDLSKQSDRIKYKSDPAAQLIDNLGSQYIRELERKIGEYGGGINRNGGAVTWDWVN